MEKHEECDKTLIMSTWVYIGEHICLNGKK
jgi:hypothetical protein